MADDITAGVPMAVDIDSLTKLETNNPGFIVAIN